MKTETVQTYMDVARRGLLKAVSRLAPDKEYRFIKAYGSHSLTAAINAACLRCRMCEVSLIRECPDTTCPLRNVRPYQSTNENADPERERQKVNSNVQERE